jgi:hypothetical protein
VRRRRYPPEVLPIHAEAIVAEVDRALAACRSRVSLMDWLKLKQRTKERIVNAPLGEVCTTAALALAELRSLPPAA